MARHDYAEGPVPSDLAGRGACRPGLARMPHQTDPIGPRHNSCHYSHDSDKGDVNAVRMSRLSIRAASGQVAFGLVLALAFGSFAAAEGTPGPKKVLTCAAVGEGAAGPAVE